MAIDILNIPTTLPDRTSLNYDALRAEGVEYLQELAGSIWTDHNAHDPGITLLEVLCFAITDLSYRTDFDMRDIVAQETGNFIKNFYTLAESATNSALTQLDYRKILIDAPGIRNAWLQTTLESEVDIYLDDDAKELGFNKVGPGGNTTTSLDIKGLYNILLEFEPDPKYGDLNDNSLLGTLTLGSLVTKIEMEFPIWEEIPEWLDSLSAITTIAVEPGSIESPDDDPWSFVALLEVDGNTELLPVVIRFLNNQDQLTPGASLNGTLKTALEGDLNVKSLILQLKDKRAYTDQLLTDIRNRYIANRNLCEDVLHVQPMNMQEIGVCMELEVAPEADCEKIMAEAIYRIGQFLSPTIRFYTLSEMLAKGKTTDEIFNGPMLDNGFIDLDELRLLQQREVIYVSDLVQILMDVPGVDAVHQLSLTNYIKGLPIGQKAEDCLILSAPGRFVPRFSLRRSTITFDKGDKVSRSADEFRALELLGELKAADSNRRGIDTDFDLEVPDGLDLPFDEYPTIQEDLPMVYGTQEVGLPAKASDKRKGQAKQLKGYLLFFEQLLANYLAQLANIRRLFAFESNEADRTYFIQRLSTVADIETLIPSYGAMVGQTYEEFMEELVEDNPTFLDRRNKFVDHLIARFSETFSDYAVWVYSRDPDNAQQRMITEREWFLQDFPEVSHDRALAFDYTQGSANILWNDPNVAGLKKRLSRLLGIHDWDRNWYNLFSIPASPTGGPEWVLVDESGNTLLESNTIYSNDSDSFDAMILAMESGLDRNNFVVTGPFSGDYTLELKDSGGTTLGSLTTYTGASINDNGAVDAADLIHELISDRFETDNFYLVEKLLLRPKENTDGLLSVFLDPNCSDSDLMAEWCNIVLNDESDNCYRSGKEAQALSNAVGPLTVPPTGSAIISPLETGRGENYETQSFLDAQDPDADSIAAFGDECGDCSCLEIKDPYSFRMCVIAPTWTSKFSDPAFRQLFRKKVRMETPAHIFVHFYFLDKKQMFEFEHVYRPWLKDLAGLPTTTEALDDMVEACGNICTSVDVSYEIKPLEKVNVYTPGDVIAYIVDPDGSIVDASLANGSTLPAGLELHPLTGELVVTGDISTLKNTGVSIEVEVWNSSQQKHCLSLEFTFPTDVDSVVDWEELKCFNQYGNGDLLATISDGDGDITNIIYNNQAGIFGALPPWADAQIELDGTVSIFILDETLIDSNSYYSEITTVDVNGGSTLHALTIQLLEATVPYVSVSLDCDVNECHVKNGMVFLKVDSPEGCLESVVLDLTGLPALDASVEEFYTDRGYSTEDLRWLQIGLDVKEETSLATGQTTFVISIWDRDTFLDWINTQVGSGVATIADGCYNFSLPLISTDCVCGPQSHTVDVTLRVDNDPVFTAPNPLPTAYEFSTGDAVLTITEPLDDGIASYKLFDDFAATGLVPPAGINPTADTSPTAILSAMGLFVELIPSSDPGISGMELVVRVENAKVFGDYLLNYAVDAQGNHCFDLPICFTDVAGGCYEGTVEICGGPPQTNTENPSTIKDKGTHVAGDILTEFGNSGEGGYGGIRYLGKEPLSRLGMEVAIESPGGGVDDVARLKVSDPTQFNRAFYEGATWVPDGAGLFEAVLSFELTTVSGAKETVSSTVQVNDWIADTYEQPFSGDRIDQLAAGNQLLVWQSNDVATVTLASGTLPAGTAATTEGDKYIIEVDDVSALFPGTSSVTIDGEDIDGNTVSENIDLVLAQRYFEQVLIADPVIPYGEFTGSSFADGFEIDSLDNSIDTRFIEGSVNSGNWGYLFTPRFFNGSDNLELEFSGTFPANAGEPATAKLICIPQRQTYAPLLEKVYEEKEVLISVTDQNVKALLDATFEAAKTLDGYFFTGPLLDFGGDAAEETAWKDGSRDGVFYELFGPLVDDLQSQMDAFFTNTVSGIEKGTLADRINLLSRIFDAILVISTDFVGNIRTGDIAAEDLLYNIFEQMKEIMAQFDEFPN